MIPRVGQWLFASCSAKYYGEVLAVGEDSNGTPTIDVRVEHPLDLVWFGGDTDDNWTPEMGGFGFHVLSRLEIPDGVKLVLRDLQYQDLGDEFIEVYTPGDGCYRCTKMFALHNAKRVPSLSEMLAGAGVDTAPARNSKADKAISSTSGVPRSPEWSRIRQIPRRVLDLSAVPDLTPLFLRPESFPGGADPCPGCELCVGRGGRPQVPRLRPLQSAALLEAESAKGLWAPIVAGGGKELLCLLLPLALNLRRAIILTEPRLKSQMIDTDIPRYGRHFRLPLDRIAGVVSYSELSAPVRGVGALPPGWKWLAYLASALHNPLDQYAPDGFICNEAHTLERDSVRTSRFWDAANSRPEAPLCLLSGTLGVTVRRARKGAARALRWGSPHPTTWRDADDWGRAVDPESQREGATPMEPGAILDLLGPAAYADELDKLSAKDQAFCVGSGAESREVRASVARRIHRTRVAETPGVVLVAPGRDEAPCALRIVARRPEVPPAVADALVSLRRTWSIDGEELRDAKDLQRVAKQLACGFRYRWAWPQGQKDEEWLAARSAWGRFVRDAIKANGGPGMDTPIFIQHACQGGYLDSRGAWESWDAVRARPSPPVEAVWLDRDFLVEDILNWAGQCERDGAPGVAWVQHTELARELAARGLSYFGGGDQGDEILSFRGPACAASDVHVTGKNLQHHFSRMLVVTPWSSGITWEQALAREHRDGQRADEVFVEVMQHDRALRDSFATALAWARYGEDARGPQRLAYADRVGFEDEDTREVAP